MIPSRRFSERATETRRRLRHHENRPRPARVFLPTRDGSVGVVAGAMKSADRLSAKGFSERSTFENTAKSGNNPGKKCCRTPPPGTLEGTATRHLLRVQCPTARSPSVSAWCTRPSWPSRRSATTVRPDPVVVSFTGLAPASSARSRMGPGGPRVRPEDTPRPHDTRETWVIDSRATWRDRRASRANRGSSGRERPAASPGGAPRDGMDFVIFPATRAINTKDAFRVSDSGAGKRPAPSARLTSSPLPPLRHRDGRVHEGPVQAGRGRALGTSSDRPPENETRARAFFSVGRATARTRERVSCRAARGALLFGNVFFSSSRRAPFAAVGPPRVSDDDPSPCARPHAIRPSCPPRATD